LKVHLTLLIGIACTVFVVTPLRAEKKVRDGVCAAFGADGRFAQAKISRSKLTVAITPPTGSAMKFEMPLVLSGDACHAFFSSDEDLIAVSIENTLRPKAPVQVAVADVHTAKWLQSAPYAATVAEDARGPLVGFLGATHTLLIVSGGTFFPDEERSLLYPVMIDLPQGTVHVGLVGFRGPAFNGSSGTVDPVNRTVWFSTKQDGCGLGSQILGEKDEVKPGPSVRGDQLRASGCAQTDGVLAFSESQLMVGFSQASEYKISAINARDGKLETATLKATGREGFLKPLATAVASGGNVAAIQFAHFDDTRSGIKRSATDIMVFTGNPFTLTSTLRISEGSELLAIGNNGGLISIAVADKHGNVSILKAEK
jgi:hypothetical protein